MKHVLLLILTVIAFPLIIEIAYAKGLPTHIGQCVSSKVKEVGPRLVGVPNSGSGIVFTNGLIQVAYEQVPAVDHSKVGDRVVMCLIELPKNCPPGDNRGKIYRVTNKRTKKSWELPDSEHMCGGA